MVQIRCKGTTKIVIFNGKTNQRDGKIVKFANYFGFLKKKYYLCMQFLSDMKRRESIIVLFVFLFAVIKSVMGEEYSVRFFDDSDGLSHWHISQILQDSTGMIWVATWNGLNRFDGHHFVTFKPEFADATYVPNERIRRFRLRGDNNLECLIEDRVLLFDTHTCRFDTLSWEEEALAYSLLKQRFNPDFDRPSAARSKRYGAVELQNIWEEYIDRQGNLWLYDDHGIYIVTPRPSRGTSVNTKDVRSLHQMRNGDIWASVRDTKEVMVYTGDLHFRGYLNPRGHLQATPISFGEMVYCMHETEEGHILLGCKPGYVLELSPGSSEIRTYSELRNAYDIQSDSEGRLWVATFGFGLWRDDKQRHFSLVPGTEGMKIRRLLFLEDGMLLAATTGGVLVVDGDRMTLHQRKLHQSHSLSSNAIMCLCMFKGNLYAGTEGGGLNRLINDLDDENWEWEHWTTENGLENDIVFELQPWSEEMLLVQGSSSLSLFNSEKETFVNFGRSFFFGDENSQLVFGEVPPLSLNDSRVLVAPSRGLYALERQKLQPEEKPIRIALGSIKRNGKDYFAVDDIDHIILAPHERNLVMRFAVLDYRNNSKILYSWRLYQSNKKNVDWQTPTNVNEVIMQDMQPGEYIFEIRSTNAYGHWQNNIRRIYITVQPTFIESTFGRIFLGGLILLIVLSITVAFLQVRFSRKKRAETLAVYLELQERLSKLDAQSTHPSAPIPEILAPGYTSENERFLNTLHQFMEQNIANSEMSIDDIALAVNMSRPTLNRRMHELFNLSAKDFVQAARIKHACRLLRTTDITTKEVAYACGFNDPNYFSKCFKTNTGLTPTEYREQK